MWKNMDNTRKRCVYGALAAAWMLLAGLDPCLAEEAKKITTPAEAIGEATRQVTKDSKAAYQGSKEAVVKTSKEVVAGAKKAFQEAKGAGTQAVEDVKKGFNKEPASRP